MKRSPARNQARPGAGLAVDSAGGPVIDPTENVIALVTAGLERQDVLRKVESEYTEKIAVIRADHGKELRRLDRENGAVIRQVDLVNARAEWDRSQQAIQALAKQTSELATTMSKQTSDVATTLAKQTSDSFAALGKQMGDAIAAVVTRVGELEKTSYKGEGKSLVADPQMALFMEDMRKLLGSGNRREGKSEGISASWAILIGAVGLIATLIAGGAAIYALNRNPGATTPQQVIYIPTTPSAVTPTTKGSP